MAKVTIINKPVCRDTSWIIPGNITYTKHNTGNTIPKIVHTGIYSYIIFPSLNITTGVNQCCRNSNLCRRPTTTYIVEWGDHDLFHHSWEGGCLHHPWSRSTSGIYGCILQFCISQGQPTFGDISWLLDTVPKKVPSKVSTLMSTIKNVLV